MENAPQQIPEEKAVIETDFDQSVGEMSQIENELERKPDNEKLKAGLIEVRNHIDMLLRDLEGPTIREKIDVVREKMDAARGKAVMAAGEIGDDAEKPGSENPGDNTEKPETEGTNGAAEVPGTSDFGDMNDGIYKKETTNLVEENRMYVDSNGFIHSTPKEATTGDVIRDNNYSSNNENSLYDKEKPDSEPNH